MARHPEPEMVRISARVPRGYEGFWQVIRELDKRGEWSIASVYAHTNLRHKPTVSDYIRRLVRGGFAAVATEHPTKHTSPEKLYRLIKRPASAPSLRRDGTLLSLPAQQRMWNAIRSAQQFDLKWLAFAASDESGPIHGKTVQRYTHHLASVGYLAELSPGIYRLKRSMDTGPRAPKILRLHVVFDANRSEVIGSDDAEAEAIT